MGIARADVEKVMSHDGGIGGIYQEERYFFTESRYSNERGFMLVCKLNLDFRPQAAAEPKQSSPSKEARNPNILKRVLRIVASPFSHGRSRIPQGPIDRGTPTDEVVKISAAYLEQMIVD